MLNTSSQCDFVTCDLVSLQISCFQVANLYLIVPRHFCQYLKSIPFLLNQLMQVKLTQNSTVNGQMYLSVWGLYVYSAQVNIGV